MIETLIVQAFLCMAVFLYLKSRKLKMSIVIVARDEKVEVVPK